MVVVDERPLKKMRSRATADMHDFLTFPGSDEELIGPFRSNINGFLRKHGRLPPPCSLFPHLLIWEIVFRIGELIHGQDSLKEEVVTLGIVEEDVSRSKSVYCDQCRVIGWSGHPVCRKRYHFIIRRDCSSIDGNQMPCPNCRDLLHFSDPRCRKCKYVVPESDLDNWMQLQLEDTTHLLHGVVHSNGYGHLLRVNGKEGGSEFLSGCDIMRFWDRLCKTLGVRKISVMDVSKKYGLEYRVLHAVTKGHPWYGDWGYEFGTGSFGIGRNAYQNAVDTLSQLPLSLFFQSRTPRTRLQDVITFYQSLSEYELTTTRDLFAFLMELVQNAHEQSHIAGRAKKPGSSSWLCTWTKDDINRVEQSIIKVLRAVGSGRWVSWRALKGAVRGVASAELVDHCLKELGGKPVDGMVVLSRCNSESDAIEYRLVSNGSSVANASGISTMIYANRPTKEHVLRDMKFLYDALLNPQTMLNYRPKTTREKAACLATTLLDCKHFLKVYKPDNAVVSPFTVQVSCLVELLDHPEDYTAPPPELVILPMNASMADLMNEIKKAFREMYIFYESFEAEEMLGYEDVDLLSQLRCLVGSVGSVVIQGKVSNAAELDQFRMERGTENWIVSCTCGARDDDGERMLACDSCSIWLHTRCAGINDLDPVPERFICWRCTRSEKNTSTRRIAIKQSSGKCSKSSRKSHSETSGKESAKKGLAKASGNNSETSGKGVDGLPKVSGKYHETGGKSGSVLARCYQSGGKSGKILDHANFGKVKPASHSGKVKPASHSGKAVTFNEGSGITCSFNAASAKKSGSGGDENSCPDPKQFLSNSASLDEDMKDVFAFTDTCSSKIASAGSGTGSECVDEPLSVEDTCSSKKAFTKHSESGWKCKDGSADVLDACRVGNALATPFGVR